MSQLPYSGYRILDFTQVISGPFAVQLLANSGAEVIKVESPSGDQMRKIFKTENQPPEQDSPAFQAANRGKRSLCIDLKDENGLNVIRRVASQCDVIVENFRPGVAKRLGLDYESMRQERNDIVYCSVSGFGQSGPLSPQSAYDGGIQAVSGMMSTTGFPDSGPVRTGYLAVDVPTALHAAFAISSAILRRERTGLGQHVDVAMFDTAMLMQISATTKYLFDQTTTTLGGNKSPAHSPLANTFQTKDGYMAVSAITAKHGHAALQTLGLPTDYWEQYIASPAGSETTEKILAEVRHAMRQQTSDHWEPLLRASGMSVEKVNRIDEALRVARQQDRPVIDWTDDPESVSGNNGYLGATFLASEDGPRTGGDAPWVGQHSAAILADLGFDDEEITKLRNDAVIR
jgi:formyl-CoA transferase